MEDTQLASENCLVVWETNTHYVSGAELQGAKILRRKLERKSRSLEDLKIGPTFLS